MKRGIRGGAIAALLALAVVGCAAMLDNRGETPPQGGETRGPVTIREHAVLVLESNPVQLKLGLRGRLPTPCHVLGWDVTGPDQDHRIYVEVYTLYERSQACVQVEEPFDELVPLGAYTGGAYEVWLNGERIGTVDLGPSEAPLPSPRGDPSGGVSTEEVELLILESYPIQARLRVTGLLPTPCHNLSWTVEEPDGGGRIRVEIGSSTDQGKVCVQVTQPFEVVIPLGTFQTGEYEVELNGRTVGSFTAP